jgi:hypothetical protein
MEDPKYEQTARVREREREKERQRAREMVVRYYTR